MYYYLYHIAEFSWLCSLPFPLQILEEQEPFLHPLSAQEATNTGYLHTAVFEDTDTLDAVPNDAVFLQNRYFVYSGEDKIIYYCLRPNSAPYVEVCFQADGNISCRFLQAGRDQLCYSSMLINVLCLENLMLANDTMLLHACFARWKGHGILFSAPSGTGKSTQGALWEKYRGAEVLNGDRAGIFRRNGLWTACGLPYAGTSGIYRDESAPIRAVVYLAQGPVNTISKLSAAQAFRLLYPQTLVHHWEPGFVTRISDLLLSLLTEIPVYYLSCTPDSGAVETLEQALCNDERRENAP